MLNFKKVFITKTISLLIAVIFCLNTTAYGIDLSTKSHLRIPLSGNIQEGKQRLKDGLAAMLNLKGLTITQHDLLNRALGSFFAGLNKVREDIDVLTDDELTKIDPKSDLGNIKGLKTYRFTREQLTRALRNIGASQKDIAYITANLISHPGRFRDGKGNLKATNLFILNEHYRLLSQLDDGLKTQWARHERAHLDDITRSEKEIQKDYPLKDIVEGLQGLREEMGYALFKDDNIEFVPVDTESDREGRNKIIKMVISNDRPNKPYKDGSNYYSIQEVAEKVKELAKKVGFSETKNVISTPFEEKKEEIKLTEVAALGFVTEELAGNIYHVIGSDMTVTMREIEKNGKKGIEVVFRDENSGIDDIKWAVNTSYTTRTVNAEAHGRGLPYSKEFVTEMGGQFIIEPKGKRVIFTADGDTEDSGIEDGTRVTVRVFAEDRLGMQADEGNSKTETSWQKKITKIMELSDKMRKEFNTLSFKELKELEELQANLAKEINPDMDKVRETKMEKYVLDKLLKLAASPKEVAALVVGKVEGENFHANEVIEIEVSKSTEGSYLIEGREKEILAATIASLRSEGKNFALFHTHPEGVDVENSSGDKDGIGGFAAFVSIIANPSWIAAQYLNKNSWEYIPIKVVKDNIKVDDLSVYGPAIAQYNSIFKEPSYKRADKLSDLVLSNLEVRHQAKAGGDTETKLSTLSEAKSKPPETDSAGAGVLTKETKEGLSGLLNVVLFDGREISNRLGSFYETYKRKNKESIFVVVAESLSEEEILKKDLKDIGLNPDGEDLKVTLLKGLPLKEYYDMLSAIGPDGIFENFKIIRGEEINEARKHLRESLTYQ